MPRPCFHKLILPSTLQSRNLRIPDHFMRKYGAELSTIATLTVPDGNVWRVGVKRVDNRLWFLDGWQEFVQRYAISVGYFLVFMYEGNSSFIVHIFNLGTSEVNYQSVVRNRNEGPYFASYHHIFDDMEDIDSIDFFDSSASSGLASGALQNKVFGGSVDQMTPGKNQCTPALQNLFNGGSKLNRINWGDSAGAFSSKGVHSQEIQSTRDIGVQFNAVEFKRSTEELKSRFSNEEGVSKSGRRKRKSDPNGEEPSGEHEDEGEIRYRFYESASARKRTVTAEERERAINASKGYEPVNPFCRVVLRPSYLYRGCIMYLPSCFAEKNLNGVSGFIKLQLANGRQWPVRCLYRGGRAKFSQGWFEFTLENNLGEGDVCVFELISMKEVTLQVTIFRVTEDAGLLNPPSPLQQNQNVSLSKQLNPHLHHRLNTTKLVTNSQ